jgi:hypothetical protein
MRNSELDAAEAASPNRSSSGEEFLVEGVGDAFSVANGEERGCPPVEEIATPWPDREKSERPSVLDMVYQVRRGEADGVEQELSELHRRYLSVSVTATDFGDWSLG